MPYKKKMYRRKPKRKNNKQAKLGKPSRGLKQSVYFFKRRTVDVVELNTQSPPENWTVGSNNDLFRQTEYKLSDLRDKGDFSNLFLMYKLTAVSVKYMFSNTTANVVGRGGTTPPLSYSNAQIMVMYSPWKAGESQDTDSNYMKDCQASKRRLGLNGGKPIKMYTQLRQLGMVYTSPTDTDYVSAKPKWISTTETNTPHYGVNICFQKADQSVFAADSNNYQSCRIETTYYIAVKGVI